MKPTILSKQNKSPSDACKRHKNLVDVDFDEIWGYDVRDVSESDSAGDAEVIKAEDVL